MSRPYFNLRALDVLRGLLAVYVLAGHARWLLWTGQAKWADGSHPVWQNVLAASSGLLRYGHEAVMVFFVLSGFFIHLRAAQQQAKGGSVSFCSADFFRRRVRRLLPPYALALVVTVAADSVGRQICPALYAGQIGDVLLDENFAHKNFTTAAVLPALAGLPSAGGVDFGSNGPLWSLAYEVVYYALYPLWLLLRQRTAVAAYVIPVGVAVAVVVAPQLRFASAVLASWPLWIAGAALAECLSRSASIKHGWLALPVGAALVLATLVPNHSLRLPLYVIGGVALVLFFATRPASFLHSGPVRLVESLGLGSYSIYIFHFPLLVLASALVFSRLGTRPPHGWFALLGGVAALALGYGGYWLCERHFLNRGSAQRATT